MLPKNRTCLADVWRLVVRSTIRHMSKSRNRAIAQPGYLALRMGGVVLRLLTQSAGVTWLDREVIY